MPHPRHILIALAPLLLAPTLLLQTPTPAKPDSNRKVLTMNQKDTGYRGIWYMNQPVNTEYVYKYSGGLGTYCAHHQPFAVHCPAANKTFFCYGGTTGDSFTHLLHMVSCYDHATGTVPRPTILLDKQTDDAHDNPVIAVDAEGYIWIFSTSHGASRPSYIHRSRKPYDIDAFDRVDAVETVGDKEVPITNFSYMQAWFVPGKGFQCFLTRYNQPAQRTIGFMSSPDGRRWSQWTPLAAIQMGHYQCSAASPARAASSFNYHPKPKGLNYRTNLYYVETTDGGRSWQSADGTKRRLPLTEVKNPALVHDYEAEGLKVYLQDMILDPDGRPIILYITSKGFEPGPENGPRHWTTARWNGKTWDIRPITVANSNYDMGSLYVEKDGSWLLVAPTELGPQPYNPGGEIAMWTSADQGRSWKKLKQLTRGSPRNHTYVRRPVNANDAFLALWADGDARKPSESRLYFCDRAGNVRKLPPSMTHHTEKPSPVDHP